MWFLFISYVFLETCGFFKGVCVCMHAHAGTHGGQKRVPGVGMTGSCELLGVGAKNYTGIKSSALNC